MNDSYKIYNFDYIKENQSEIIQTASYCYDSLIEDGFGDTTWSYYLYNIFSVSSPSFHFLEIYKKLIEIIKENIGQEPFCLQAWLNYHDYDKVLDWHNHTSPYHGYICLEPQDTTTEFFDWEIKNEVGNIYFGPGNAKHRVVNNSKYSGKRITIGYDVIPNRILDNFRPTRQYGAIPIF